MHSGVNSGVVITSDLQGDRASGPLGDMVNVAARLQSLASAGEIYIGPETRSLVAGRFALTDLGDRELKGRREPVRVTRVDGLHAVRTDRVAPIGGLRRSPGGARRPARRSRPTARRRVVPDHGVRRGRCGQDAAARGGAVSARRRRAVVRGHAYPYTADIPYAPLVDLFNSAASIDENNDAVQVRDKLHRMVTGFVAGRRPRHGRYRAALRDHPRRRCCRPRSVSVGAARRRRTAARCRCRAPTVVCLQDLHWVDPSTATLVRDLVGTISEPVVTICNFRPGFELGAPNERLLHLSELSARQSREQLMSLLDGANPPTSSCRS